MSSQSVPEWTSLVTLVSCLCLPIQSWSTEAYKKNGNHQSTETYNKESYSRINTTKIQICEHKIQQTQKENFPTLLRLLSHVYTTAVLCHINLYKATNFIVSLGYSFLTLLPTCTVDRSKAHWFTFVGSRWVSEMLTSNMEKQCETYYIFVYMRVYISKFKTYLWKHLQISSIYSNFNSSRFTLIQSQIFQYLPSHRRNPSISTRDKQNISKFNMMLCAKEHQHKEGR